MTAPHTGSAATVIAPSATGAIARDTIAGCIPCSRPRA